MAGKKLTKDEGKEEKGVEDESRVCFCGSPALIPASMGEGETGDFWVPDPAPMPPNFPILCSQPRMAGSFPLTQVTFTPSIPSSFRSLAQTAANASPICLNGTRALPVFGGLSALDGVLFFRERERTMDGSSVAPNRERKVDIAAGVVRFGYAFNGYFNRIVVSSGSTIE